MWHGVVSFLGVAPPVLRMFIGCGVILVCLVGLLAGCAHVVLALSRLRRERLRIGWLGHLSAVALLWIGIGSAMIISERPFPYSRVEQHQSDE